MDFNLLISLGDKLVFIEISLSVIGYDSNWTVPFPPILGQFERSSNRGHLSGGAFTWEETDVYTVLWILLSQQEALCPENTKENFEMQAILIDFVGFVSMKITASPTDQMMAIRNDKNSFAAHFVRNFYLFKR